jgi:hypothetical protein
MIQKNLHDRSSGIRLQLEEEEEYSKGVKREPVPLEN